MPIQVSPTKRKILYLLLTGLAFQGAYTPNKQIRLIEDLAREWKRIDAEKLKNEIRSLYRAKLVSLKENRDGTFNMVLTDKGKIKSLNYYFEKIKIESSPWDKKWRIVTFDIPEKLRKGRNALREKLLKLGFYEFQKSVLIFPYECKDEIDFLIEFFNLRKYVRYGVLESIDNDLHLRKVFKLP